MNASLLSNFRVAELPPSAEAFRDEIREFLSASFIPPAPQIRARSWMGFDAAFSRKLANRGWVGVTIPTAYGGANLDAFSRFVLIEELLIAGAPVSAHWIADRQSGPIILNFGSEAQKNFYLPRICAGEAFFCIGMSEPNSGSDLTSVTTRATRIKGGWLLNGKKIWTTNAAHCNYMMALVRTSGVAEDRHRGLSQIIVDLSLPGITIKPIFDLAGDAHFNEVFFDDVILSEDALIGNEGDGWMQVNAELAFERSGPERIYSSIALLEHWIQSIRQIPSLACRHAAVVGRFATHLATLRRMSIAVTSKLVNGESPIVEAALMKDIGTAFEQEIPALLEDLISADSTGCLDENLLATLAYLSQVSPTFSLRGGTREILRGMIARGLGLR